MAIFLDSNVLLYSFGDDPAKKTIAIDLLKRWPCISIQVLNECTHVLRRKLNWSPSKVAGHLEKVMQLVQLKEVGLMQVRYAWRIAEDYGYSHYDSLIIATALTSGCTTLYTEDMQDGQLINDRLRLANPFSVSIES
jgi:predicted nucleic acid-binding protein